MTSGGPEGAADTWSRVRQVVPWVVAAAILAALFWKIPLADAWRAAREAELLLFAPAMLAAVSFWFAVESRAFAYLFSRFNAPLTWAEARALRGATYLVTPINWNLGTAAIVVYLRRSKNIGAVDSTSSLLFYGLADGIVLAGLALVGVSLLPASPETLAIRNAAAVFGGGLVVFAAAFMAPLPRWRWLARLRGLGVFRTHALAKPRDVATLVGLRCLYFSGFAAIFWVGLSAFGVTLPAGLAMAATPAILVAGGLPITPSGLGTQAAAMVFFFSAHGDAAAILAFGLAFPVALSLSRLLLGILYLRTAVLLRGAPAA